MYDTGLTIGIIIGVILLGLVIIQLTVGSKIVKRILLAAWFVIGPLSLILTLTGNCDWKFLVGWIIITIIAILTTSNR